MAYVLSENVNRRHLTVGQRAMIGESIAKLRKGHRSVKSQDFGIYTQQEAAEMIGTSPQRILQARIIRQWAPMEAVEVANGKPLAAAIPNCQ